MLRRPGEWPCVAKLPNGRAGRWRGARGPCSVVVPGQRPRTTSTEIGSQVMPGRPVSGGKGSAARFTIRGRCRPGSRAGCVPAEGLLVGDRDGHRSRPDLSRALVGGVEVDGVEPECLGQLGPGAGGGLRAHDPECGDGITPLVMTRAGRAALSAPRRHYSASRLREATHFGVGPLLGGRGRGDAVRAGVRLGPRGEDREELGRAVQGARSGGDRE